MGIDRVQEGDDAGRSSVLLVDDDRDLLDLLAFLVEQAGLTPLRAADPTTALELLRKNSRAAATAVRAFTDEELDRAAPFSLSFAAPVTAQFVLEDHALRHSWHHLARIRSALGR